MPFITASIPGDNKAILIHVPSAGIYLLKSKSSAFISLVPYFALHILCEVLNQGESPPVFPSSIRALLGFSCVASCCPSTRVRRPGNRFAVGRKAEGLKPERGTNQTSVLQGDCFLSKTWEHSMHPVFSSGLHFWEPEPPVLIKYSPFKGVFSIANLSSIPIRR